ncbi:MAG: error-prone DNA polymerase [Methylotenera sp.]|nr:error-prone DNA polymerase [Oligoflexia bacterium]
MATLIEPTSYAELMCKTHYSFLEGASHPHELMEQATRIGLHSLAITDRNGVYGVPKAYLALKKAQKAAAEAGNANLNANLPRLIVGAELQIEDESPLILLARDRAAYGMLCRILTSAHADKPKGEASLSPGALLRALNDEKSQGLLVLSSDGATAPSRFTFHSQLKEAVGSRYHLSLSRMLDGLDPLRTSRALDLAARLELEIVATNQVHYHHPSRRNLQDLLTSTRIGKPLAQAGKALFSNSERCLKSPRQMIRLFSDLPRAISNTVKIAESCTFSMSELRYRYPSEWIPAGETAQSHLVHLVWKGARSRYGGLVPTDVETQIEHELNLIEELGYADYFLTIWEIVDFARSRKILCQGRGSAANSVVCYCLEITAVDPVRMSLLFERFISAERDEPPDIDVDFEHERREEVIQHIYEKYGRDRAAMVAAVVTYRSKSAVREVSKALGEELSQREFRKETEAALTPKLKLADQLISELLGFPRHLSIHSGGFTLSKDPIIETVPVEPARMEGRSIVQWDKNDLDALGLLKVDVLSLGMLTTLRKTMEYVVTEKLTLATIPAEDPKTYAMIQRADTIGTFQIESRAQMSMLPRLLPKTFYDLVIEVALVRPGPIVGKMVHPYLKRRRGLEPVVYPDERLRPILHRTLGVPLFQEQVMKIAIVLGGFTPGEADELRRAIGAWRSSGLVNEIGQKLMRGLLQNGISRDYADLIFTQLQGFAEYGFPESHAASFALLAYASSYLKCHHPAEFTCALLNSQPMGFYAPHTLVDDVKRHGVTVLPLHPNLSEYDCTLEDSVEQSRGPLRPKMKAGQSGTRAIRLGWRYVAGMSEREAEQVIRERNKRPFTHLLDFITRTSLRRNILNRLALGQTFECFGLDARSALWEILSQNLLIGAQAVNTAPAPRQLLLFQDQTPSNEPAPFLAMEDDQTIHEDYQTFGLSTRGHPMQTLRKRFPHLPKLTTVEARRVPHGKVIEIAGLSIVMQRPPTANGTVFATLEDETGVLDLILHNDVFEKHKELILDQSFLVLQGTLQRDGLAISLIIRRIKSVLRDNQACFPLQHSIPVKTYKSDGVRS